MDVEEVEVDGGGGGGSIWISGSSVAMGTAERREGGGRMRGFGLIHDGLMLGNERDGDKWLDGFARYC